MYGHLPTSNRGAQFCAYAYIERYLSTEQKISLHLSLLNICGLEYIQIVRHLHIDCVKRHTLVTQNEKPTCLMHILI